MVATTDQMSAMVTAAAIAQSAHQPCGFVVTMMVSRLSGLVAGGAFGLPGCAGGVGDGVAAGVGVLMMTLAP
jgi:hypothetical protein